MSGAISELSALKTKLQATWRAGDFGQIAKYYADDAADFIKRLDLKPGITGLWQVLGRSDIPFDEMTKLDYVYVTNWSLREDIRLILLTIPSLLRPRRAF